MKTAKTYVFKRCWWWLLDLALALLVAGLFICLIINARHAPLVILLVCSIPAYMLYLQQYGIRVTWQYNRADAGKTIIINEDRNQLTFIHNNRQLVIQSDDVKKVLMFDQPTLGKFGTYTYMVICTESQNLLITDFTIPRQGFDPILSRFLSKKPRETFTTRFNFIKPEYLATPTSC